MQSNDGSGGSPSPLYLWYDKQTGAGAALSRSPTPDDPAVHSVTEVVGDLKERLTRTPNDLIYISVSTDGQGVPTVSLVQPGTLSQPVFRKVPVYKIGQDLGADVNVVISVYVNTLMIDVSADHPMPPTVSLSLCDDRGPFTPSMMVHATPGLISRLEPAAAFLIMQPGTSIYLLDCDPTWSPAIVIYQ